MCLRNPLKCLNSVLRIQGLETTFRVLASSSLQAFGARHWFAVQAFI